MPQLSWNEIQDRATEFSSKWQGESQSLWGNFLDEPGTAYPALGFEAEYAQRLKGSMF